jgi:hypothetical protein
MLVIFKPLSLVPVLSYPLIPLELLNLYILIAIRGVNVTHDELIGDPKIVDFLVSNDYQP